MFARKPLALMAEFYSANLAAEVPKGMGQKAKLGAYAGHLDRV
jgi:hypothetical protein